MQEDVSLSDFMLIDGAPLMFDQNTYVVNDDQDAIWAMRNLAQAQRHIDKVAREAAQEKERIDRWQVHATKTAQTTVRYFTNVLQNYVVRVRESEGRKSISLPDGELSSRAIPAKAQVADLDLFLKWASDNRPQWIRVKQEADLSAIREHVTFTGDEVLDSETGEVVEGLQHIEEAVSVQVKVVE
jgi:histone H3/H4